MQRGALKLGYQEFLARKVSAVKAAGFSVDPDSINDELFDFQKDIVRWSVKRGRSAIFAECGLGKTPMQLEWANQVHKETDGNILVLAPLAVSSQTKFEGDKFGIPVNIARDQSELKPGINVTNYERLDRFDTNEFAGVVLDESSILKSYMGKTKRALIDAFADTPYKLCCTATPAPNDYTELGNHVEFLGIMPSNEMLARWFINDTMHFGKWRLKGHAEKSFWDWVASWAVSLRKPSDLGYPDEGFELPPLNMHEVIVPVDQTEDTEAGQLFRTPTLSATDIHREMRRTAPTRAAKVAEMVNSDPDSWVVWCNTNYEADELMRRIPDAVEVRGSDSPDSKERKLLDFSHGKTRVMVTKPSIAGFGLNWQHCHKTAFVGLSYSFEQLYQAVRRLHRFGQEKPVDAYLVVAETEGAVLATVQKKMEEHDQLMDGMNSSQSKLSQAKELRLTMPTDIEVTEGEGYIMYLGDCVETIKQIEDDSIHFSIFSPPFSNLYIYSDAIQDMGNSSDDDEFFHHFNFLIPELYRVTLPGRLCAVHCKQLVNYKGRDGMAGLRDFRGEIIRHFINAGWAYHSEVCIWKDPVIEMQRTKAQGLLYKQLRKDSSLSRVGMPEYLILFRRWPHNEEEESKVIPIEHTHESFPLDQWQEWASPIWMDIRQTNVLNVQQARDDRDEKHICPLQLDLIERAMRLWSNPGETILSPFAGIGSEGYVSLKEDRKFVGIELKRSYYETAIKNLEQALMEKSQVSLFDDLAS